MRRTLRRNAEILSALVIAVVSAASSSSSTAPRTEGIERGRLENRIEDALAEAGNPTQDVVCAIGTSTTTIRVSEISVDGCLRGLPQDCTAGGYLDCIDALDGTLCEGRGIRQPRGPDPGDFAASSASRSSVLRPPRPATEARTISS